MIRFGKYRRKYLWRKYLWRNLKESSEPVRNPGMGWYRTYPLFPPRRPDTAYLETTLAEDEGLCLLEICLEHYRQESLDREALESIKSFLSFFAERNKRLILRGTYDLEGKAYEKEPDSIELICTHMEQLVRIFLCFRPHICLVQGLLVGAWGEMHSSRYVDEGSLRKLYACWERSTGGALSLAVRTPELRVRAGAGWDVGLFDDALLYDDTDMGTFPGGRRVAAPVCRRMAESVPFGGEAVGGEAEYSAAAVLDVAQDMELSYLNIQYDERVLSQWKRMVHKGESLFDIIDRRMGYRFYIRQIGWRRSGHEVRLELIIENTGFARCYEELYLEAGPGENTAAEHAETIKIPIAPGAWKPGGRHRLRIRLPESLWQGAALCLKCKRDGQTLYFANKEFSSTLILPMGQP